MILSNTGIRQILIELTRSRQDFFAQHGEDAYISPLVPQFGFYIDIGSGRPVSGNNTFFLYKRGWRGILVDPLKMNKRASIMIRPRDTFIEGLCGSRGFTEFYEFFPYEYSTTSQDVYRRLVDEGAHYSKLINTSRLETFPLSDLEMYIRPELFMVMSIDVEGKDLDVLRTWCMDFKKPEIILIENHANKDKSTNAIQEYLYSYSYQLLEKIGPTEIYLGPTNDKTI